MMGKKPPPAGQSPEGGWYYVKAGARTNGSVGPLRWEELQALAASGVLWPIDLVLHPILPQWDEANQIPGLFSHTGRSVTDKRGPSPRRARAPATRRHHEQPREHPAYQPAWTAPSPRRRSRALPFLLPLLVSVILGGALALYLVLWRSPDNGKGQSDNGSAVLVVDQSVVNGYWRGTATLTVLRLGDGQESAPGSAEHSVLSPAGIVLLALKNIPLQISITMKAENDGDCRGSSIWLLDLGPKYRVPTMPSQNSFPVSLANEPQTMPFTGSANGLRFGLVAVQESLATATATVGHTGEVVGHEWPMGRLRTRVHYHGGV